MGPRGVFSTGFDRFTCADALSLWPHADRMCVCACVRRQTQMPPPEPNICIRAPGAVGAQTKSDIFTAHIRRLHIFCVGLFL